MKFTVFGGNGFIGRHLNAHLKSKGHEVNAPSRDVTEVYGQNLGHVIYAIGMTGNFRDHPHETVQAHVGILERLLEHVTFESWLYLSSTRVYAGQIHAGSASEDDTLNIRPGADSLYDISKLLGEAMCLSRAGNMRVARLSNVYGSGQSESTFLGSVLRDLAQTGCVTVGESPESGKDYVYVGDVVNALESIALSGRSPLYNVASGCIVTHKMLAESLISQGFKVNFTPGGAKRLFPPININRLQDEFGLRPRSLLDDLPGLLYPSPKTIKDHAHE